MSQQTTPQKLSADALEGHVIAGKYRVAKKVSHGGMAWVYQGTTNDGLQVALKILFAHHAHDEDTRRRLWVEAEVQSQLNHPNIVHVIDTIDAHGIIGIVMDWVEGTTLHAVLNANPAFGRAQVTELFLPVIDAVGYGHVRQVIHRDLKPSNVLLEAHGNSYIPKVADFGIAKVVNYEGTALTKTDNVIGTIYYMSPEQMLNSKTVDPRSDVYSLGVILYQLVTRKLPFKADTMPGWMYCQQHQEPIPPTQWRPEIPQQLERIILKSLAKDPDQRYQDCRAFYRELYRWCYKGKEGDVTWLNEEGGLPEAAIVQPSSINRASNHIPTSIPSISGASSLLQADDEKPKPSFSEGLAGKLDEMSIGTMIAIASVSGVFVALLIIFLVIPAFRQQKITSDGGVGLVKDIPEKPPAPSGLCVDGTTKSCYDGKIGTENVGSCRAGKRVCQAGSFGVCLEQVLPKKELCNGKDDDCDGQTDEDFPNVGKPCVKSVHDCKFNSVYTCDPTGRKLVCDLKHGKASDSLRYVFFQFTPNDIPVKVAYSLGASGQFRRKSRVSQSFCFEISRNDRKATIDLESRGYEVCSFSVPWKTQKLKIKLKKKTELGAVPDYCLKKR